jgi:hypothetical protein
MRCVRSDWRGRFVFVTICDDDPAMAESICRFAGRTEADGWARDRWDVAEKPGRYSCVMVFVPPQPLLPGWY